MRDLLLNEALRRLAAETATRFSTLVATGDQIPFDVAEQAGPDPDDAFFHSYVPLTARYVREREAELRSLPGFEPAREAVAQAGVAAPYLEQRGEAVPAEPGERAARLLTVFMASLWDGCTEFSLDRERLDGALAVLDAEAGDIDEADVVVVPVAGLQMPLARLQLPHGAQLVRADTFEAPIEAMRSEGMGRAAWEPQFLAIAEQGEGANSAAAALRQLRELVSVMRLFRQGGVGLGPHAFAPSGEGRWRRISTGAPAPRGDGYKLSEEETAQLAEFAETLEARPDPAGPLAWAVRRFELGCERPSALEGLSDHLLALRAVLDGQGPVGASLPMRAAALIADGSTDRLGARERIEAALELERAQMSGSPPVEGAGELASWVEESVRRILREAALGELGADLNEAADETLIATGLDAGDIEIAVAAQEPAEEPQSKPLAEPEVDFTPAIAPEKSAAASNEPSIEEEHDMNQDTRILEPVPAENEIRITATDWLHEVEAEDDAGTIEWPAGGSDVEHRERIDTPRVRHLFPVPEDADWEVRELKYDHYRGAG
ncbi:MAG TPA: hypothetical protein VLK89_05930 [Solirubrobacterales bacterium]|nr:hypothetical protein [Solirubrobacterales bacterium]